jgi:hypothetical protein
MHHCEGSLPRPNNPNNAGVLSTRAGSSPRAAWPSWRPQRTWSQGCRNVRCSTARLEVRGSSIQIEKATNPWLQLRQAAAVCVWRTPLRRCTGSACKDAAPEPPDANSRRRHKTSCVCAPATAAAAAGVRGPKRMRPSRCLRVHGRNCNHGFVPRGQLKKQAPLPRETHPQAPPPLHHTGSLSR